MCTDHPIIHGLLTDVGSGSDGGGDDDGRRARLREAFVARLEEIRDALPESKFFRSHQLVRAFRSCALH